MIRLEDALSGAGLSEKEAKVYLASLELGPATALQIARKSGINRGTTYLIAENLMQRGLMSAVNREGGKNFCAEPPAELMARIEKEHETLAERRTALSAALPELEALVKTSSARPAVRYYEGLGGIATMREILYKNRSEEILNAVDMELYAKAFPQENASSHYKNAKLYNLHGRILYTCSDELNKKLLENLVNKEGWKRCRVAEEKFPFAGEVVIFRNTIALLSYANGIIGAVIEHEPFAKTMRALFEMAWGAAITKEGG